MRVQGITFGFLPLQQGDERPADERPGCLLFLRREESLEATSRGQRLREEHGSLLHTHPEGVTPGAPTA